MSLQPAYGLTRIFDQSGYRFDVYRYWGPGQQKSGRGQDNDRTNLLESILGVMGTEKGAKTQLAWNLVSRYARRYPGMPRDELLQQALQDPSTDLYSHDDALAEDLLKEVDRDWDLDVCEQLTRLFDFIRAHSATPDYATISAITCASRNNTELMQLYPGGSPGSAAVVRCALCSGSRDWAALCVVLRV